MAYLKEIFEFTDDEFYDNAALLESSLQFSSLEQIGISFGKIKEIEFKLEFEENMARQNLLWKISNSIVTSNDYLLSIETNKIKSIRKIKKYPLK